MLESKGNGVVSLCRGSCLLWKYKLLYYMRNSVLQACNQPSSLNSSRQFSLLILELLDEDTKLMYMLLQNK